MKVGAQVPDDREECGLITIAILNMSNYTIEIFNGLTFILTVVRTTICFLAISAYYTIWSGKAISARNLCLHGCKIKFSMSCPESSPKDAIESKKGVESIESDSPTEFYAINSNG